MLKDEKEKKIAKIHNTYKVEVYGEQIVHSGEVFENLITRDVYRDEILARKSIGRIMSAPSRGSRILFSIKEGKSGWEVVEVINLGNRAD